MSESFPNSVINNYELQEQQSGLIIAEDRRNHPQSIEQTSSELQQPATEAAPEGHNKQSSHYNETTVMVGDNPLIVVESVKNNTQPNAVSVQPAVAGEQTTKSTIAPMPLFGYKKPSKDQTSAPKAPIAKAPEAKPVSERHKRSEESFYELNKLKADRKRREREARQLRQREQEKKAEQIKSDAILKKFDTSVESYDTRVEERKKVKAKAKADKGKTQETLKIDALDNETKAKDKNLQERRKRKLARRAAKWVIKGWVDTADNEAATNNSIDNEQMRKLYAGEFDEPQADSKVTAEQKAREERKATQAGRIGRAATASTRTADDGKFAGNAKISA